MSDDFDSLFDSPAPAPAKTAAAAAAAGTSSPTPPTMPVYTAPAPAIVVEPERPYVWLQMFRPGSRVHYREQSHTVSHVRISRGNLFVHLIDQEGAVPAELLRTEWLRLPINVPMRLLPPPAISPTVRAVPAELGPVATAAV